MLVFHEIWFYFFDIFLVFFSFDLYCHLLSFLKSVLLFLETVHRGFDFAGQHVLFFSSA